MKRIQQYLTNHPLHPMLIAIYPILFLYSHNINELPLRAAFIPAMISLSIAAAIYFSLSLIIGNKYKKGLFLSLFIFVIFSYGHLLRLLNRSDGSQLFFLLYSLLFLGSSIVILKSKQEFRSASLILNLVSLFLVTISLITIISHEIRFRLPHRPIFENHLTQLESIRPQDSKSNPDIYYLIFDRYGSSNLLEDYFNFDNSPFENYLKRKGFYIAADSKANYPYTFLSLASSLNLSYLDFLRPIVGKTADKTIVYNTIKDSIVANFLKSNGYTFYNFGSWWQPSRKNPLAEKNIFLKDFTLGNLHLDEFGEKLFRTTWFYHLLTNLLHTRLMDPDIDRKRILFQFEELEKIARQKGPKFIFSHSLSTHPPFYFDSQGNVMPREDLAKRSQKELYCKSVSFTNNRLKKVIEAILTQTKRPVIIIIQADEGPWADVLGDPKVTGNLFRRSQLRASIFNAFYVSPQCRENLYSFISPVNTFRLIFNHYFGTRLPQLEDRVFLTLRKRDLYQFTEITHRLIYGTIVLKQIPHPARILLDGKDATLVDQHKIRNVKPGIHTVEIIKDGFKPWQTEVEVKPARQTEITINRLLPVK